MSVNQIACSDNCYLLPLDQSTKNKNLANSLVKEVAIKTAKELAVCALFAGVCCLFAVSGGAPIYVAHALVTVTLNAVLRTASAVNTYVARTKPFFSHKNHEAIDVGLS